jgi:DNA-binding PadR family transcriptional regulator
MSGGPKQRILEVLLEKPTQRRYGYELIKSANVQSGTLYPQLARMEGEGVVTSGWDTTGRRPRRYYQLTGHGIRVARLELATLRAAQHAADVAQGVTGTARPADGGAS